MILIAHRGLTQGPDPSLENKPEQILLALSQGYHCEVDVRFDGRGRWFLGHDDASYEVDYEFLEKGGLWLHAKDLTTLYQLNLNRALTFFWHQEDDFTLTSKGDIWTYPGKPLTKRSIQLMPEWNDPEFERLDLNCMGICSDYVERIRAIIANGRTG